MVGVHKAAPKQERPKEEALMAGPPPAGLQPAGYPALLTFTINTTTGEIVNVESLDDAGGRHELSDEEKVSLARDSDEDTLEAILEEAFEAGIGCVLDSEPARDDAQSSTQEEIDLRHLLVRQLIGHSPAQRLVRDDVLNRAIVRTLIKHSTTSCTEDSGRGSAQHETRGTARRPHQPN